MNTKREEIFRLVEEGQRPSTVFRAILEQDTGTPPTRLQLAVELKALFGLSLTKLSCLGGWAYFEGGQLSDENIDNEFRGCLVVAPRNRDETAQLKGETGAGEDA